MTSKTNQTTLRKSSLFRVQFYGGSAVITTAANALQAEQKARRQRPGFVETVRIVKGKG